jgi:tol-pal system protein YbgF
MRHLLRPTAVALFLAAAMVRPAAAANKEHQQLMADIRILQEQAQQLQNLIGSLNETLKAVNARLDDQTNTNRKSFADQKLTVDTLSSDLRIVREKVDDNNVRVSQLSQEVDALRQAIQQAGAKASTSAEPSEPPSANGVASTDPGAANTSGSAPIVAMSPQRLYDAAESDYFAGQWDLAIQGFESYIRSYPRSDKADDAQVYIGNSYLQAGKNDKAVEAYDEAIRTYANGNAVPEAYYKKGLALRNLRQADLARQAFEYAAKTYPDSAAGQLAKQQLTQLGTPPAR